MSDNDEDLFRCHTDLHLCFHQSARFLQLLLAEGKQRRELFYLGRNTKVFTVSRHARVPL